MSDLKDHVRLKPYKPAAGQVKRTYSAPWEFTYRAGIWYVEPEELAEERGEYLATVHMNSSDDFSPKAFNICTRAEAEHIKLYEESGELEKVVASARPAVPPAPTTAAPARPSQDLNLPSPKSELAAAASAAATATEDKASDRQNPTPRPKPAPVKRSATKRTRRRKPGK